MNRNHIASLEAGPLASPAAFEEAFAAGLLRQLAEGGLGPFVLVLANALTEPYLLARLEKPLRVAFERLEQALAAGTLPAAPADDRGVIEQLVALGEGAFVPAERRAVGPWEVRFNLLRALRPPRMTGAVIDRNEAPFAPEGFNFNKPFLLPERLWAGELLGRPCDLFYNKFPFMEGHLLLVPEREACRAQRIDEAIHHDLWALAAQLGSTLPGAVIGYNAYGAFASVNHLHFHLARPAQPLPVLAARWHHNGGAEPYPTRCEPFADPTAAWACIAALHAANRTYQLLYTPGRMLLFPRPFQGRFPLPPWAIGSAWYENAGGVIAFDRATFERITEAEIGAALSDAAGP